MYNNMIQPLDEDDEPEARDMLIRIRDKFRVPATKQTDYFSADSQ